MDMEATVRGVLERLVQQVTHTGPHACRSRIQSLVEDTTSILLGVFGCSMVDLEHLQKCLTPLTHDHSQNKNGDINRVASAP